MKTYRVALIGIGGYGAQHVRALAELAAQGLVKVVAYAELQPDVYPESRDKLAELGAAYYSDYERMLTERPEIDLVSIATPIAAHRPMCIRALELGFHVLVEKPPAVTIQDLDEMIAAQRASGRLCQVNFMNTSGQAFRQMLDRLSAGAIGRVTDVTGIGMWQRTRAYYERTGWAGKLTHNGQYVLDGTFNNPLAHLLHNCLLAAGQADPQRMAPDTVQAELYHVNEIEGDDISCIRARLPDGVTVNYYAMLCHSSNDPFYITVKGTEGEMRWTANHTLTISRYGDGRREDGGCDDGAESETERYAYDGEWLLYNMYVNLLEAIGAGEEAGLYSPLEACRGFVLVSNGAYESAGAIHPVPEAYVIERPLGQTTVRLVPELSQHLLEAAGRGALFSEYPIAWAKPTLPVRMQGYSRFDWQPQ